MPETIQVPDLTSAQLEPALRRGLGMRAFVSGIAEVGRQKIIQVGPNQFEIIDDDDSGQRTIAFTQLPDVISLEVERSQRGYLIRLPKSDPQELVRARFRGLIARHEGEVLKHSYRQLVHISEVDLAMRPISDILVRVHNYGTFVPPAARGGTAHSRSVRMAKYTRFLSDLGFVRQEGAAFVPGPKLPRGFAPDAPEQEIYEEFMGRVLQSGHQFMTEVLHLTMIKPFLRIENSYYWPAHRVGEYLRIRRERFGREFSKYYGPRPPKFEGHLQSLIRKGSLVSERGVVTGAPEILEPLLKVDFDRWAASGAAA